MYISLLQVLLLCVPVVARTAAGDDFPVFCFWTTTALAAVGTICLVVLCRLPLEDQVTRGDRREQHLRTPRGSTYWRTKTFASSPTHAHNRCLWKITWPPPPPEEGVRSSDRSFARRALSMPRCPSVALFRWVLSISCSISLIRSRIPILLPLLLPLLLLPLLLLLLLLPLLLSSTQYNSTHSCRRGAGAP